MCNWCNNIVTIELSSSITSYVEGGVLSKDECGKYNSARCTIPELQLSSLYWNCHMMHPTSRKLLCMRSMLVRRLWIRGTPIGLDIIMNFVSLFHMVINWFSFFFILSCGFTCVMIHILDNMIKILFHINLNLIFVDLGSKFLKENKVPWTLPSIHEITSQV